MFAIVLICVSMGAAFEIATNGGATPEVAPGIPVDIPSLHQSGRDPDLLLRYPLDEVWPGVHLAPYMFASFGGILLGNNGNGHSVSEDFIVT
jgi:hypothetical protein